MCWEERVRRHQPKLVFSSQRSRLRDVRTQQASVRVRSDYSDPDGHQLVVAATHMYLRGITPRVHLFFLPGGPGAAGSLHMKDAEQFVLLTHGDINCWLVDHRGLGASGEFFDSSESLKIIQNEEKLRERLTQSPFPLRDLTCQNAALDVGAIAIAIQNESTLWMEGNRMVIFGFSYGSYWTKHTIVNYPNLFDAVVMSGHPGGSSARPYYMQGLVENCALDPHCRTMMGQKGTEEELRNMIIKLGTRSAQNRCIQLLRDKTGAEVGTLTQADRVNKIASFFGLLFVEDEETTKNRMHPAQVLLPLVKATIECNNYDRYERNILNPILKWKQPKPIEWHPPGHYDYMNTFMHFMTVIDYKHHDFTATQPSQPLFMDDMFPRDSPNDEYRRFYQGVKGFLDNRKPSSDEMPISQKTAFYLAGSRMDFRTPLSTITQLYTDLEAIEKHLLIYDHRPHDGYSGECMTEYVLAAAYGQSDFDFAACMERENKAAKLDWSFQNHSILNAIWDGSNPGEVGEPPHLEPSYQHIKHHNGPTLKRMTSEESLRRILDGRCIEWEEESPINSTLTKQKGTILLPKDYMSVEGSFNLTLWKYSRPSSTSINTNLIIVGGSAGTHAEHSRGQSFAMACEDCAVFVFDHRGMGESGEFFADKMSWNEIETKIRDIAGDSQRWKLLDEMSLLTLNNVAGDLASLSLLLHSGPSEVNIPRLVLYGWDYGARVAHHAVYKFPELFDSVILYNIQRTPTDVIPSMNSLLTQCSLDSYCHSMMGESFITSVESIITSPNECAKLLAVKDIDELAQKLEPLTLVHPQVLLPFIKATAECVDLFNYQEHVLNPTLSLITHLSNQPINEFVRTMMTLDGALAYLRDIERYDPVGPFDLHPFRCQWKLFGSRIQYDLVAPPHTELSPPITHRTTFDVITNPLLPSDPGRGVFEKLPEGRKVLLEAYNQEAVDEIVLSRLRDIDVMTLGNPLSDPNWKLTDIPGMSRMWDYYNQEVFSIPTNPSQCNPLMISVAMILAILGIWALQRGGR